MRIQAEHIDGLRFLIGAGKHSLLVDASEADGGTNSAMDSRQLFVSSVAACVLSFVVNSLRLRGFPLQELRLDLDYEEARRPQRISRLDIRLHAEPEIPAELQRAILAVAERSIVPNTLRHPPEMRVALE
jgi:uncharacterized OsmC-like protein